MVSGFKNEFVTSLTVSPSLSSRSLKKNSKTPLKTSPLNPFRRKRKIQALKSTFQEKRRLEKNKKMKKGSRK